jgi:hypothetical protein
VVWDYMRFFDYLTNKMIIGKGREIVKIILPIKGSFLNELTGVLLGDGLTKSKRFNFKNLAQNKAQTLIHLFTVADQGL